MSSEGTSTPRLAVVAVHRDSGRTWPITDDTSPAVLDAIVAGTLEIAELHIISSPSAMTERPDHGS